MVNHNYLARVGDDAIAVNGLLPNPPANNTALPTNIQITNNDIAGWSNNVNGKMLGRGIMVLGITNSSISNNIITNTYGSGILVTGCDSHTCPKGSGNLDPTTSQPWQSSHVTVAGNTITNAGQLFHGSTLGQKNVPTNGIYIYSSHDSTVSGNSIKNSLSSAIGVSSCLNCQVQAH